MHRGRVAPVLGDKYYACRFSLVGRVDNLQVVTHTGNKVLIFTTKKTVCVFRKETQSFVELLRWYNTRYYSMGLRVEVKEITAAAAENLPDVSCYTTAFFDELGKKKVEESDAPSFPEKDFEDKSLSEDAEVIVEESSEVKDNDGNGLPEDQVEAEVVTKQEEQQQEEVPADIKDILEEYFRSTPEADWEYNKMLDFAEEKNLKPESRKKVDHVVAIKEYLGMN